jgi:GNAT superfamily N-acetyltransferase
MINRLLSRGILYSIGIVINRIVPARLFRFRVFRVYQLQPSKQDRPNADDAPFQFQWCESDEDFRLAEQLTGFQSGSDVRQLGYGACLALDSTQPVGGLWRAEEQFDEDELGIRVVLDDDQAWIFAAMVSKQHRRRGVHRRLLSYVLASDPHRNHFASINPTNRASIAAHRQFVGSTVGTCVSFRLFKVAVALASGGLKLDRHISLGCRERPIQMRLGAIDLAA